MRGYSFVQGSGKVGGCGLLERRGPRWTAIAPVLTGTSSILHLGDDAGPWWGALNPVILVGSVCLAVFLLWPGPRMPWTFPATQDQVARARRELMWGALAFAVAVLVVLAAVARAATADDWRQDPLTNGLILLAPVPLMVATFFLVLGFVRRQASRAR